MKRCLEAQHPGEWSGLIKEGFLGEVDRVSQYQKDKPFFATLKWSGPSMGSKIIQASAAPFTWTLPRPSQAPALREPSLIIKC